MNWMRFVRIYVCDGCFWGRWGESYEACDAYLRSGVTELCECSVEEAVLLPERFDIGIRVRFRSLEGHVCISDLWDRRAGEKC